MVFPYGVICLLKIENDWHHVPHFKIQVSISLWYDPRRKSQVLPSFHALQNLQPVYLNSHTPQSCDFNLASVEYTWSNTHGNILVTQSIIYINYFL